MKQEQKAALESKLHGLKAKRDKLSSQSPKPVRAIARTENYIQQIEKELGQSEGKATRASGGDKA